MSRTIYSYGLMALVADPDPLMDCSNESHEGYDAREAFAGKLENAYSILNLSYDGKIVFLGFNKHNHADGMHFRSQIGDETPEPIDVAALYDEAKKFGIQLHPNTQRVYQCTWWNGSSSPMKRLTADSYTKRLSTGGNHA